METTTCSRLVSDLNSFPTANPQPITPVTRSFVAESPPRRDFTAVISMYSSPETAFCRLVPQERDGGGGGGGGGDGSGGGGGGGGGGSLCRLEAYFMTLHFCGIHRLLSLSRR